VQVQHLRARGENLRLRQAACRRHRMGQRIARPIAGELQDRRLR
jgi:hypothetical protein